MAVINPQPMFFGPEARPLCGWLHRPAATARAGLLICSPFGNEALCAHRTIRHLAAQAADAGFAALRFDYDGTGDSAGHSLEAARVEAWLGSIDNAADALRQLTGVQRLYLAGFRLGATLATLACLRRSDVAGLIVIVPAVRGVAYVRELKMLQRAIDARRDVGHRERASLLETAGFLLTAQTQASLAQIDLNHLPGSPCERVLVVDRAEMPVDLALVPALRASGSVVDHVAARGYTAMMLDPHESIVPQEILDVTIGWLDNTERTVAAAAADARSDPAASGASPAARPQVTLDPVTVIDPTTGPEPQVAIAERLVQFGTAPGLFGVLSAPMTSAATAAAPGAVLLANAGAVHHVGPNRLHVTLARHLARLGHTVLRMDIAGIGDSAPHDGEPENVVHPHTALQDVRDGADFLRRQCGAHEVRVVGLCSGAYHALKGAIARLPIDAAVIVNPLTFFWKDGMPLAYPQYRVVTDIMRYRTNSLRLASWRKLLSGQVDLRQLTRVLWQHLLSLAAVPRRAAARAMGRPLPDDLPTELGKALSNGIGLHFVFSDGDPGFELLRQQGGGSVRRMQARDELSINVIPAADHTFTDLKARATLIELLTRMVRAPARGARSAALPERHSRAS